MAVSYRSRFLTIMRSLERELAALFQGLSDEAIRTLVQAADATGTIPIGALFTVQQSVQTAVMRRFVARTGEGTLSPFMALPNGDILPLSSYSRILFDHIGRVEALAIEQQRSVAQRLTADAFQGQLRQTPLFRPNPLAQYEQAHTWVDPNGYQLSERIWNTAGNTRRRLDLFLDDAIRSGRGVLNLETRGATGIARDLEQFLLPGRQLRRTSKPYGIDASYDAMRLARTDVTRAHVRAFENGARLNPFVVALNWNLSRSHKKRDICDDLAEGGPYPLDNLPTMPAHPQDMCYWSNVLVENPAAVFADLGVAT
jgi:hypothetical protein